MSSSLGIHFTEFLPAPELEDGVDMPLAAEDQEEEEEGNEVFHDDTLFDMLLGESDLEFRDVFRQLRDYALSNPQALAPFASNFDDDMEELLTSATADAGFDQSWNSQQPASVNSIESLKVVEIQELGWVCSICLEEFDVGSEAKKLPCSHLYHGHCIGKWLKRTNSCPLCRHRMT